MRVWRRWLLLWVALVCGVARAAGLQVAPVSLTLQTSQQADGLWLSNTGEAPLHAQVRVFRWTQMQGQERLQSTTELVVSPPMLELAAAGRQLVRVIRNGPPPAGATEIAYRVLVDELPLPDAGGQAGLNFVMRHSLPVFVAPAGAAAPTTAQLRWALQRQAGQPVLEVTNDGNGHAQLAELAVVDAAGQPHVVHAGLLGYVLPGAVMRWPLKLPGGTVSNDVRWQVTINGIRSTPHVDAR